METRASYVLIGAFTIFAIFAGLGFFLWLAKVQIDKTYTQYDILFDQVPGLAESSPVRFNGVDVGTVLTIALDRTAASKVRVRIEVSANTPIRQGTEATLASQGVTGVAFVGLDGGTEENPRLPIDPLTGVAEIPSKSTTVQGLIADAPDLLKEATTVLENINKFTTTDNAERVGEILANLNESSGRLTKVMDDMSKASVSISAAAENIAAFSGKLDSVAENAGAAISDARKSLSDIQIAVGDFRAVMDKAQTGLTHVNDFAEKGLPQFTTIGQKGARLLTDMSQLVTNMQRDPARFFLGNRTPVYKK